MIYHTYAYNTYTYNVIRTRTIRIRTISYVHVLSGRPPRRACLSSFFYAQPVNNFVNLIVAIFRHSVILLSC